MLNHKPRNDSVAYRQSCQSKRHFTHLCKAYFRNKTGYKLRGNHAKHTLVNQRKRCWADRNSVVQYPFSTTLNIPNYT